MSEQSRRRAEHESVASLIATPKSSVWQGFLGAAWVVSSSLLLEVIAKLLEGSVGQSPLLNSLAGVLRWVAVAVVLAAALYVVWRKTMDMREGARIRRELDLTADLVQPPEVVGRTVAAPAAGVPSATRPLDPGDLPVVAVLCALSFDEYESAALYDMVSAMLGSATVLPGDRTAAPGNASDLLTRLAAHDILRHRDHDRFAVVHPHERPPLEEVRRTPQWRAALPALVAHYADRAGRWAVALDSDRLGAGADRWFAASADRLTRLLQACAEVDHGIELDITVAARIADALDLWYARTGLPADGAAARAMRTLATAGDPEIRELAAIRCGDPMPTRRGLRARVRMRRRDTGLRARRAHESALRQLEQWQRAHNAPGTSTGSPPAGAAAARRANGRSRWWRARAGLTPLHDPAPPLAEVVDGFERAWWLLPRRDIAGEVSALVDLAIVHLHQGRLEAARDRLELAEVLTRGGRNPTGRAHTFEVLGVLWWMRGEARRALRWWLLALTRYRGLGHELGICRCLQHLGSAATVAPEYGSLLLEGPLDTGEVLRQAAGWLAYAEKRRPDAANGGSRLAERYHRRVAQALRHAGLTSPETVDRWPVRLVEQ